MRNEAITKAAQNILDTIDELKDVTIHDLIITTIAKGATCSTLVAAPGGDEAAADLGVFITLGKTTTQAFLELSDRFGVVREDENGNQVNYIDDLLAPATVH